MLSRALLVLAIAAAAPLAQAQQRHGVMRVSVTVVNTCFFGQQARCRTPEAGLRRHPEAAAVSGDGALRRRVVHF